MKKIYLVMSQTGTIISIILKLVTKKEYNHISLALDRNLSKMYSFGRKWAYNPFVGVFVIEDINKGTFKRFKNTTCRVIEISVTEIQYEQVCNKINKMVSECDKYTYNLLGLLLASINIEYHQNNKFYCSEFVRYILTSSNIDTSVIPNIAHPVDFLNMDNNDVLYEGLLTSYRKSLVRK
ncbi:MAG: hypothetical protein J6D28_02135 [Bacilli bacterium]|nr:hypothetical protein [Bacilli bacterium]